jgi:hypothetical protein
MVHYTKVVAILDSFFFPIAAHDLEFGYFATQCLHFEGRVFGFTSLAGETK